RRASMRRSKSTIGFSKSSQVPFTRLLQSLERNRFSLPVHERNGALAEARLELRDQFVAQAHEQPARADLRLRGIRFGAYVEVYRAFARVATQEVPEHFQRNVSRGLGEVDVDRLRRGRVTRRDGSDRLKDELRVLVLANAHARPGLEDGPLHERR